MNANIPDPNLRLTLVQALWTAGLATPFDKKAFFRDVLGETWHPRGAYNDELDERVRDALLAVPLSDELLAQLRFVGWDGGLEVFRLIWENRYAEDETFDVHDLRGIERCVGVEYVQFTSGLQAIDLSPLAKLEKLSRAMLFGRALPSLEPLRDLPLRQLSATYVDNPKNREVLAVLQARGVDLSGMRVEE